MSERLLVELFTEELPPKALQRLEAAFAEGLNARLVADGFVVDGTNYTSYSTPRRLAVSIAGVAARSADKPFKQKLLPVSVAYDANGQPTQALVKKLAALGLDAAAPLTRESDGKADALFHQGTKAGLALHVGLQAALDEVIAKLPIPKVMSYASPGGYDNNQKFVRPAHRLVALHGADVVPATALGLTAGRTTAGHRFLSRGAIDIATAEAYAPTLEAEGKVIPSFAARRAQIVVALEGAAGDATPIMPDALLDEVTALVEWPAVYSGSFDPAYLSVPQECLILTMQLNQRYIALADDAGNLTNRFLVVSNIATRDPAAIINGNERVLRARLADAKFFFDQDRRQRLDARLERLRGIVYHNKFGAAATLADRVERVRFIAQGIAPMLGANAGEADRAAQLAKADLVTDMVGEFPELQGLMGRYYATHDGEPASVAAAIEQHYWPKVAGGALPEGPVAQAVALADKLEVLAGMFGIGLVPTGDKDPFGLRRAALGVIRIIVEGRLTIKLWDLLHITYESFPKASTVQDVAPEVLSFINERLRGYLRDQGYTANEVAAVVDAMPSELWLVPAQLAAIRAFETLPEAAALSAANKRISNILKKSGKSLNVGSPHPIAVDATLMVEPAERALAAHFEQLAPAVEAHCKAGRWSEALLALASAKPVVDQFFVDVMVMADDPAIRENRLDLLQVVGQTMNRVADISKLAQ